MCRIVQDGPHGVGNRVRGDRTHRLPRAGSSDPGGELPLVTPTGYRDDRHRREHRLGEDPVHGATDQQVGVREHLVLPALALGPVAEFLSLGVQGVTP